MVNIYKFLSKLLHYIYKFDLLLARWCGSFARFLVRFSKRYRIDEKLKGGDNNGEA